MSWPPDAVGGRGPDGWVLAHALVWESLQRLAREQLKKSGGFAQVGAVEAIRGEVDQGRQAAA